LRGSAVLAATRRRRWQHPNELTKVGQAETTARHAIRNAIHETVDLTGLCAGPDVGRFADAIFGSLLHPLVRWAIGGLAAPES
jgi:hypothetical protein